MHIQLHFLRNRSKNKGKERERDIEKSCQILEFVENSFTLKDILSLETFFQILLNTCNKFFGSNPMFSFHIFSVKN